MEKILIFTTNPQPYPRAFDRTYTHAYMISNLGLCSRSKFDIILDVFNDELGYVAYRGRTNTLINYDPVKRIWLMRIVNDPDTYAVSLASLESLLMGSESH